MNAQHTLGREQLRDIERSLRSSLARRQRSMWAAQRRRNALRARGGLTSGNEGSSPAGALSADTLERHQELVAAIRRLEAGAYGVCERCGAAIDHDHLARNPEAAHCAKCAAL